MAKYLIIIYLVIRSSSFLNSQTGDLRFDHISLKDGLSQNTVTCILKDSRGFMWFGTKDGLNRFDGKSMKVYKHQPDSPNSLSNNNVQAIHEDKNGTLWIGTYGGGLNKFERKTENFKTLDVLKYVHIPQVGKSLSTNAINTIFQDSNQNIWVGTRNSGVSTIVKDSPSDNFHFTDLLYEESKKHYLCFSLFS